MIPALVVAVGWKGTGTGVGMLTCCQFHSFANNELMTLVTTSNDLKTVAVAVLIEQFSPEETVARSYLSCD